MRNIDERPIFVGLMAAGIAILATITICLIFVPSFRLKLMPEGLFSMNLVSIYMLIFICAICVPILFLFKNN